MRIAVIRVFWEFLVWAKLSSKKCVKKVGIITRKLWANLAIIQLWITHSIIHLYFWLHIRNPTIEIYDFLILFSLLAIENIKNHFSFEFFIFCFSLWKNFASKNNIGYNIIKFVWYKNLFGWKNVTSSTISNPFIYVMELKL